MRRLRNSLPALLLALSGCKAVVLHPSGDVAVQQRDLLVQSTILMLLIVVPVMALTLLFAWRYRASNKDATYEPDWDHSTQLELFIWGAPLLIIICLGAMTWMGTHLLDPFRRLDRIAEQQVATDATNRDALQIDAIALDWKWLFIYPQYGVATVNQMAVPANRAVEFHITASSVMNALFIPAMAGQIYAMPGMETQLHAVMNQTGTFEGISSNYSGAGFSGMHFSVESLTEGGFAKWVARMKQSGETLNTASYLTLEAPSENVPPMAYSAVEPGLYRKIVNICVKPGTMCISHMMAMDAMGGMKMDRKGGPMAPAVPAMEHSTTAPPPMHGDAHHDMHGDMGKMEMSAPAAPAKQ